MLDSLNITMAQWTNNFIVPMAVTAVVIAAYVILCTKFLKNRGKNAKLIPVRVVFFMLIVLEVAKIFYLIGRDGNFYPNRYPIVFCSMAMYAYPIFCFKKNRFSDVAKGFSVLPSILAFIMFASIQYKYNMSIIQVHSYIYHGSMLAVAIYLITSGLYRFEFRKFYTQSLAVGGYIAGAAVISLLIGGNISVFGPGDPYLGFLYDLSGFGVGICVMLIAQFAVHAGVYGLIELGMRRSKKRRPAAAALPQEIAAEQAPLPAEAAGETPADGAGEEE